MFKKTALVALLVAGSLGMTTTVAGAAQGLPTTYTLTKKERKNACGNFGGTIIYGDGSSLDCSTGVATLPSVNES